MSAIGPGDYVECIRQPADHLLTLGALYLVIGVQTFNRKCNHHKYRGGRCDKVGFELKGHEGDHICSTVFRPVYRPKASVFRAVDVPAQSEKVDA